MISLIEDNRLAMTQLCQQYRVYRLSIFGSAISERFDPSRSDLDFLVSFADRQPTSEYADRYLGFADGLEKLLGRRIDLVSEQSIHNPFFRHEVETTRKVIYEQSGTKAPI